MIKNIHNQYINNKNNEDTTTINTTYNPILLQIKYQGKELLLMNSKGNMVWDYHVPPDHRLAKPNLCSANHPYTMFQA